MIIVVYLGWGLFFFFLPILQAYFYIMGKFTGHGC